MKTVIAVVAYTGFGCAAGYWAAACRTAPEPVSPVQAHPERKTSAAPDADLRVAQELAEARRCLDASEKEREHLTALLWRARIDKADEPHVKMPPPVCADIDALAAQFEEAWKSGDRNASLSFLQRMKSLDRDSYPRMREIWTIVNADRIGTAGLVNTAYGACFTPDFLSWLLAQPEPDPARASDPENRGGAAYQMKGLPDICDRIPPESILRTRNVGTAIAMIETVAMSPDPRAHTVLLSAALQYEQVGVRRWAITLLGTLKTPEAVDALRQIGREADDPEIRRWALDTLEKR